MQNQRTQIWPLCLAQGGLSALAPRTKTLQGAGFGLCAVMVCVGYMDMLATMSACHGYFYIVFMTFYILKLYFV